MSNNDPSVSEEEAASRQLTAEHLQQTEVPIGVLRRIAALGDFGGTTGEKFAAALGRYRRAEKTAARRTLWLRIGLGLAALLVSATIVTLTCSPAVRKVVNPVSGLAISAAMVALISRGKLRVQPAPMEPEVETLVIWIASQGSEVSDLFSVFGAYEEFLGLLEEPVVA